MVTDEIDSMFKEADDIHRVWHDFQRRFFKNRNFDYDRYHNDGDFADSVFEWIIAHKEDAAWCSCDDDHHASSEIILVRHKDPRKKVVWGVTFIYLAQMGDERTGFFYPGHSRTFLKELSRLSGI